MHPTILELRHTLVYTHNNTLIHETIHYYHPMLTAIYEVILVFEYILGAYEAILRTYDHVNFNAHAEAPKDHLAINLKAAWRKATACYTKLNASPAYYAQLSSTHTIRPTAQTAGARSLT
jgi:hypothetical protein